LPGEPEDSKETKEPGVSEDGIDRDAPRKDEGVLILGSVDTREQQRGKDRTRVTFFLLDFPCTRLHNLRPLPPSLAQTPVFLHSPHTSAHSSYVCTLAPDTSDQQRGESLGSTLDNRGNSEARRKTLSANLVCMCVYLLLLFHC